MIIYSLWKVSDERARDKTPGANHARVARQRDVKAVQRQKKKKKKTRNRKRGAVEKP